MSVLLSALNALPEYPILLKTLKKGRSAAVTGIGQINRTHLIAGLRQDLSVPMVVLCQDDMAAKRLQEELKDFLGRAASLLPSRELTLYDASAVSRERSQTTSKRAGLRILRLGARGRLIRFLRLNMRF